MAILPTLLITLIFSFLLITFLGWIAHWAMHQPWSGKLYVKHRTHHEILYPNNDLFSDTYREAGIDDSGKLFILLFSPIILLILALGWLGVLSWLTAFMIIGEMGLFGYAHDFLHERMHLKKSWWHQFGWFQKWIGLHVIHHYHTDKNLGIFNFLADRVFGTFKKE